MSYLDIIIGLPLLLAAYMGFRDGIVVQLGGIIGLIIGIFLAFRYGLQVGCWIGLEGTMAQVAGFLLIVVASLLVIGLLGKVTKGLFKFAGLGALDSIGGIILGVLKMGLLLSVLLIAFDALNARHHWITQEKISGSVLYEPVRKVSEIVFPYVDFVKEKLI